MRLHHLAAFAIALLTALVLTSGDIASARSAPQPAQRAAARIAAAVTETAKVTLPETSIAGPGFDGDIAWTGTDAAHHLNVRLGTGGLAFPTKITLPETSPFSPAVTLEPSEGPVTNLEIAWTGTDAAHHLNVEFLSVSGGSTTLGGKQTLSETSIAGPSILFDGTLSLAWTGTDTNHSLNVLQLAGPQRGQKAVLPQFSSNAGPSLTQTSANEFVLGWSVRGTQRLNLAESSDGMHFASELGAGLPETSAATPQFTEVTNAQGQAQPCIAWTGTDPAHHLNIQCTTTAQFPQFPNPAQTKTVLSETALDGPGFGSDGRGVGVIAWTGTDAAHHLNVAQFTLP